MPPHLPHSDVSVREMCDALDITRGDLPLLASILSIQDDDVLPVLSSMCEGGLVSAPSSSSGPSSSFLPNSIAGLNING